MNVQYTVYYTYLKKVPDYIKKALTVCMDSMPVTTQYFDINTTSGELFASCLDREPLYGVEYGGTEREYCSYEVRDQPIQLYMTDNEFKTNCHNYHGRFERMVPKVIAKAGLRSNSYGIGNVYNRHKMEIKYICADSYNNYAGAGTKLFKVIVDSLQKRECYEDIGEDEPDPNVSLYSGNNTFYDNNPELFEKNTKLSDTYNLKPEGFKRGTKAGDRDVKYHRLEDEMGVPFNTSKVSLGIEHEMFEEEEKETWKLRDQGRPWKPPVYPRLKKKETKKRVRNIFQEEESEEEDEKAVDQEEVRSIHVVPPAHRVIGRVYRHAEDGRVVWDGEQGVPEGMWNQMYPDETEGTGYASLVRGAGYAIKEHTREQAKKLGVTVKPSTSKDKKIDVHKGDKKVASVGQKGYTDYATLLKTAGKQEADKRRQAYKSRHEKTRHRVGSNSYYADKLLW